MIELFVGLFIHTITSLINERQEDIHPLFIEQEERNSDQSTDGSE